MAMIDRWMLGMPWHGAQSLQEAHSNEDGEDPVLLREAIAQTLDANRVPPTEVVSYLMQKHGLSWAQAVADIKSFAQGQ